MRPAIGRKSVGSLSEITFGDDVIALEHCAGLESAHLHGHTLGTPALTMYVRGIETRDRASATGAG